MPFKNIYNQQFTDGFGRDVRTEEIAGAEDKKP